ncbi:aldolase/citrate lyase family protein, partial [Salmonella enterica]|uniref:aldolase/citrate lyase family protein n=1 Tax=Salmonella enterica TaxID=28901 RepID=UPI00398C53D5
MWRGVWTGCGAEVLEGGCLAWVLMDGDHALNDVRAGMTQLQAIAPYPSQPVVRPSWNERATMSQLLAVDAQTLPLPKVQKAAERGRPQAVTLKPDSRHPAHGMPRSVALQRTVLNRSA